MADRPLHLRSDEDLEGALRAFADEIGWPVAAARAGETPDIAASVRARIEAAPAGAGRGVGVGAAAGVPSRRRWNPWPVRRALVAAVIILLGLAVIVGAAGLGLPGLRLIFGPPPVSPPPSVAPTASPAASGTSTSASGGPPVPSGASPPLSTPAPGSTISLGEPVPLDTVTARAGFAVTWPADPAIGPPDAAYIDPSLGGQVALVWAPRAGLPTTLEPGVGLILTEFRGDVEDSFYSKALGSGTTATLVQVHGARAFWLTGDPHFLFYTGPGGFIHEDRRWIGDALIWARGPVTYRLETSLGREAAIRIAESMP